MRDRWTAWAYFMMFVSVWAVATFSNPAKANSTCDGETAGSGAYSFHPTLPAALAACEAIGGTCKSGVNGSPDGSGGFGLSGSGGTFQGYYCSTSGYSSNRTNRWVAPRPENECTSTQVFDYETGLCEDDVAPLTCAIDEMTFRNEYGVITSCVSSIDPDAESCQNPQGYINNIELCGDDKNQCEAAGGDFGYLNGEPMCLPIEIPPAGDECPSGYVVAFTPDAIEGIPGTFQCVLPENIPPTICDASRYDCDGDGNVDDQNNNGLIDNGTSDSQTGYQGDDGAGGENVGYDDLNPAVEGAGDCDPTSKNYAECAGFVDGAEDTRGEREDLSSGDSMETVAGNVYTRLENVPIVLMISNVTEAFSFSNGACPTPSFNAFGTSFSIDFHCQLYLDIASILSAIMMLIFSIAGIRHIASA
jgi:hypothetical protein